STSAQTVEEFYRSKSITMLVGGGAGGGYDTYARVFARHLSRHIPGNPNIIAKNMPAAAGLAAASTLYGAADKDGATIAAFTNGAAMAPGTGRRSRPSRLPARARSSWPPPAPPRIPRSFPRR